MEGQRCSRVGKDEDVAASCASAHLFRILEPELARLRNWLGNRELWPIRRPWWAIRLKGGHQSAIASMPASSTHEYRLKILDTAGHLPKISCLSYQLCKFQSQVSQFTFALSGIAHYGPFTVEVLVSVIRLSETAQSQPQLLALF